MSKSFALDILSLSEDKFMEKYQQMEYTDFQKNIRTALLEQDRDTRHAITNALTISDRVVDRDVVCNISINCCDGCQLPS